MLFFPRFSIPFIFLTFLRGYTIYYMVMLKNLFNLTFMKKFLPAFAGLLLLAFSSTGPWKDGMYSGTSRAFYTDEPYFGSTSIRIENGKISKVEFSVYDSAKHEYFNADYEKYFAGNEVYIQQCRHDWKAIQSYPDSLLKYQDLDKVDAISGATWSYNIFKASAEQALSRASK
jgi:major membrane immunogen (membrane-anchored lipoprotein)